MSLICSTLDIDSDLALVSVMPLVARCNTSLQALASDGGRVVTTSLMKDALLSVNVTRAR